MLGLGVNKLWTSSGQKDEYAVLSQKAPLVAAFDDEYYRSNGSQTTFSDLITHSRTSNATMVDSDGLIKWGPHNLLTYSEDFTQWTDVRLTVDANEAVAPDGTLSADKITEDGSNNTHAVYQKTSQAAGLYTASVFAKAGERDFICIRISTDNDTKRYGVTFDLSDGTFGSDSSSGSPTQTSYSISDAGNGWYLISVSAYNSSGEVWNLIATSNSANPTYSVAVPTYLGDSSSGIYIWGGHLYRSDLGGMVDNPDRGDSYVPTTSSAVYLPRRGHHVYNGYEWVNEGVLAESEARTNLVVYSNDPTNADWTNVSNRISIGSNTSGGPYSSYRSLTVNADGAIAELYQVGKALSSGSNYCGWVVAKYSAGAPFLIINLYDTTDSNTYAWFDIQSGTVGTANAGITNHGVQSLGDGWYLCWAYKPAASTSGGIGIEIGDADGSITCDSGDAILFAGCQLEQGSTPSSYIPTSGSTVTRAAETFTIPSANLPWPTPQYIGDELVTNGTFDTDLSDWTVNGAVWESGQIKVTDSSAAYNRRAYQYISGLTVGKVYALTATIDQGTMTSYSSVQIRKQSDDGVVINTPVLDSGTFTVHFAYSTPVYINILVDTTSTSSKYAYFDNISVREINPLSVSIQMDGRMTYADEDSVTYLIFWQKSTSDNIQHYLDHRGALTGKFLTQQKASNISDTVGTADVYTPDILVPFNFSTRHGTTFVNNAVDGIASTANTTPVELPDLSTTDLILASDLMGTIKTFRIWDKDLGDTGIEVAST